MTMIERVATALSKKYGGKHLNMQTSSEWFKALAKVAIDAMQEPTPEMCEAGAMTMPDYDPGCDDAKRCWETMIDIASKE